MTCHHTTAGCNYPQGECSGACLADKPKAEAAAKQHLTIVYQIHSEGQYKALLSAAEWVDASDSHAIAERYDLQTKNAELSDQCLQSVMAIATLEDQVKRLEKQRDEAIEALTLMTVDQEGKEWVDSDLSDHDWDVRVDLGRSMARSMFDKAGAAT